MSSGLIYCGGEWDSSFCITKLIEAIIAAVLILVITAQILLDVRMRGSLQMGFTQVIQLLMLLTLICNLAFCLDHQLSWFYYSESFLYDCYFCTLVFYVTYRIIQKAPNSTPIKLRILKISYVTIVLGFFAIFIYSGLIQILDCKEVWFIGIDVFGILICSIMVQFGYKHHQSETQKFMDFKNENQLSNPLSRMWTLILINLFCQVVQLTESLVFFFQSDKKCHFSDNQTVEVVLKFIFSFFSLHLSFICTIWVFNMRRMNEEESYSHTETSKTISYEIDNNMIEMALSRTSSGHNPNSI